jgi:NAD(P)H-hydrate repair Nnr-like enzyme with NAD(P)H-hydrate dehydratase domain
MVGLTFEERERERSERVRERMRYGKVVVVKGLKNYIIGEFNGKTTLL